MTKRVRMEEARWGIVGDLLATALPQFSLDVVGVVAGYLVCKPLSRADQQPHLLSLVRGSGHSTLLLGGLLDRVLLLAWSHENPAEEKLVVKQLDMDSGAPERTVSVPFPMGSSFALQRDNVCVYSPSCGVHVYNNTQGTLLRKIPHQQHLVIRVGFAFQEDTSNVFIHVPWEQCIDVLNWEGTRRVHTLSMSFLGKLPEEYRRVERLLFQPTTGRLCVQTATAVHLMDDDGKNLVRLRWPGDEDHTRVDAIAMDRRGRIFVCLQDERMVVFHADGTFCTSINLRTFSGLQPLGRGGRIVVYAVAIDVMERIWIDDGFSLSIHGFVE